MYIIVKTFDVNKVKKLNLFKDNRVKKLFFFNLQLIHISTLHIIISANGLLYT